MRPSSLIVLLFALVLMLGLVIETRAEDEDSSNSVLDEDSKIGFIFQPKVLNKFRVVLKRIFKFDDLFNNLGPQPFGDSSQQQSQIPNDRSRLAESWQQPPPDEQPAATRFLPSSSSGAFVEVNQPSSQSQQQTQLQQQTQMQQQTQQQQIARLQQQLAAAQLYQRQQQQRNNWSTLYNRQVASPFYNRNNNNNLYSPLQWTGENNAVQQQSQQQQLYGGNGGDGVSNFFQVQQPQQQQQQFYYGNNRSPYSQLTSPYGPYNYNQQTTQLFPPLSLFGTTNTGTPNLLGGLGLNLG